MLSILLVLLAGCPSSVPNYPYEKEPDPRSQELILGVGDVVAINVWGQADLNTEGKIRPDGTITMPLVGDIKAAGRTPTELKSEIKERVGSYIKLGASTEITVAVRSWNSYKFTVSGEVGHQGVLTSDQYIKVSQALAMAGGLSRFAKRGEIQLLRKDPKSGKIRKIPLDYDSLASGARLDMDIYVLPGDEIYVP